MQVGSVAATVFLARLLTPAEFGIVALAQSLLGAAQVLSISGIRAAIVTRKGSLRDVPETYFWTAAGFALFVTLLVVVLGVPLTRVLGQPQVAPYLVVLTPSFIFNSVAQVPLALLQRRFRFSAYNAVLLVSSIVYFVSEVLLAWVGLGAWSVVIGQVVGAIITVVLAVALARWVPRFRFDSAVVRHDFSFVSGVTLNWALAYVQKNVDYWLVSARLGGSALGIYYIAYVVPNIVRQRLTTVTNSVLLPAYSSVEEDPKRLESVWQKTWLVQAGLGIPAMLGIAALAAPLVAVFFGPQWSSAVLPMQILTLVALVDVHMTTVGALAVARRRVRWNSVVLAIRAFLTCIFVLIAVFVWASLPSVAWAVALAAVLTLVVQDSTAARWLGVGLRPVAIPFIWFMALGLVMAGTVAVVLNVLSDAPEVVQLVVGVVVGVAVYLGLGMTLARRHLGPVVRQGFLIVLGR